MTVKRRLSHVVAIKSGRPGFVKQELDQAVRLLPLMGVEALYPKRRLSQPEQGHRIYPYLVKDIIISGPDQIGCSDITSVPMANGFIYLVAELDGQWGALLGWCGWWKVLWSIACKGVRIVWLPR